MKKENISTLSIMDRMAKDNNQGICLSTTIVNANRVTEGVVVGFGLVEEVGKDAFPQQFGVPGKYMFMCFAVKKDELEKTRELIFSEKNQKSIDENEENKIEAETESNALVIDSFMVHCKENGIEIPDTLFESFFNA